MPLGHFVLLADSRTALKIGGHPINNYSGQFCKKGIKKASASVILLGQKLRKLLRYHPVWCKAPSLFIYMHIYASLLTDEDSVGHYLTAVFLPTLVSPFDIALLPQSHHLRLSENKMCHIYSSYSTV
jgi:hypothetical protein